MIFAIITLTADQVIFRRQTDLAAVASYLLRSVERLSLFKCLEGLTAWPLGTGTGNTKANFNEKGRPNSFVHGV